MAPLTRRSSPGVKPWRYVLWTAVLALGLVSAACSGGGGGGSSSTPVYATAPNCPPTTPYTYGNAPCTSGTWATTPQNYGGYYGTPGYYGNPGYYGYGGGSMGQPCSLALGTLSNPMCGGLRCVSMGSSALQGQGYCSY